MDTKIQIETNIIATITPAVTIPTWFAIWMIRIKRTVKVPPVKRSDTKPSKTN